MTEMSMNRAIHGAFRRDLNRFVNALSSFPPGDLTRAQQLGRAWENFQDQLDHHHRGEHDIAWPALVTIGVSQDLLTTMDAEHETMATALAEAGAAMHDLTRTAGLTEARTALDAMRRLQTITTEHLDHEEAEIEQVYLDNQHSDEMRAMGRKFGQVGPARGGRFFAWVLDGATPEERAAITSTVPGPVLKVINGVFGRSYRKNIAPAWQ